MITYQHTRIFLQVFGLAVGFIGLLNSIKPALDIFFVLLAIVSLALKIVLQWRDYKARHRTKDREPED